MRTSVWYTDKLNDGEDFISLNDVDLFLVYLGKGVFWGTKEKPSHAFHHLPEPEPSRSAKDEGYVLLVYEPESPHRTPPEWSQHLRQPIQQPLQRQNVMVVSTGSQNRWLLRKKATKFGEVLVTHVSSVVFAKKNLIHKRRCALI